MSKFIVSGIYNGKDVSAMVSDLDEFINIDGDAEILYDIDGDYHRSKKNEVKWTDIRPYVSV